MFYFIITDNDLHGSIESWIVHSLHLPSRLAYLEAVNESNRQTDGYVLVNIETQKGLQRALAAVCRRSGRAESEAARGARQ